MDKMSFYTQVYKHKSADIISRDDETVWRRQTPKLLYPLGQFCLYISLKHKYVLTYKIECIIIPYKPSGAGQTNLWMPQGVQGQVIIGGEQGYVVRWEFSYSSWTLFTCEVEMLLHVVSTAGTQLFAIYFFSICKIIN